MGKKVSILLKSLSPGKDAVVVTIVAPELIQNLWESRNWVNPRVFLRAAQATLACLAVQGMGDEDSQQNIEMQWAWKNEGLHSLYADSLFQGAVRTSFSWTGDEKEDVGELDGTFQMRRKEGYGQIPGRAPDVAIVSSGIVTSAGDVVADVQDILHKSEQVDSAIAISVRWAVDETQDAPKLKITVAHAYLLHVLPPPLEYQRGEYLAQWHNYLSTLGSPADWVISENASRAAEDMTNFIFASNKGMKIFSKPVMFYCSCSEEKILRILKTLPKEDIDSFEKDFEVTCKYCSKIYLVDKSKSGLA